MRTTGISTTSNVSGTDGIVTRWIGGGAALLAFAAALVIVAPAFGPEADLGDTRPLWLAAGLVAAGLAFCVELPRLIRVSAVDEASVRVIVVLIVAVGLIARAVQFAGEPIIEDDYQRYLWDGAVSANGFNPYATAPDEVLLLPSNSGLGRLAETGRETLERVNHPEFKTIYPPVAQAAFALAHAIAPWSLPGWRTVCLAGEVASLLLLFKLLRTAGRSPLWIALYWWNPLIIKEMLNSSHMEALLMPLVLASLLLSVRQRHLAAIGVIGLAAGAKLWPILLAPLLLRPLANAPWRLLSGLLLLGVLVSSFALPVYLGGLNEMSGFVVYVDTWKTNSALFPALEGGLYQSLAFFGLDANPGKVVRVLLGGLVGGLALGIARRNIDGAEDLLRRAAIVVAVLVLVSPSQYPWYMAWLIPFLVFFPITGLLAVTALVPTYYASFYFHALDDYSLYRDYVVWLIWLPIWVLTAVELGKVRRARTNDQEGPIPG